MKILCTGGSGFLGKYIQKEIEAHGHTFINFDISQGQDILKRDEFYTLCASEKPDVIIHAAAVADLYESDKNLDRNFSINVMGTYYIGRICSILDIPLIYISTCCAYGNESSKGTLNENVMPIPTETYAWSKLAGEKALGCVGGLNGCILRLGTFYGPGMRDALFNAIVINKALADEEIVVHGDGTQRRQYVHVADVAKAVYRACLLEFPVKVTAHGIHNGADNPLQIFNIIGTQAYSVKDTIRTVEAILGKQLKVKYDTQREGQIMSQRILNFKAQSMLWWEPEIEYYDGMKECVEFKAYSLAMKETHAEIEADLEFKKQHMDKLQQAKHAAYENMCEDNGDL